MNTAKDRVVFFDSMTNDVCATIRASWCEGMDCTFEAIECVGAAIHGYLERLVVIVPASFAYWHGRLYSTEIDLVLIFHPKRRFLPTPNWLGNKHSIFVADDATQRAWARLSGVREKWQSPD